MEPECELGYTRAQLKQMIANMDDFDEWMRGQTQAICEGRSFNHDTREYETACGGVSHGVVTYRSDVNRYLAGARAVD